MTRSIFDPTGGEADRSGSTHLGPDAGNISRMPPDLTDAAPENEPEEGSLEAMDRAAETPEPFAVDAAEAARRLNDMLLEEDETQAPSDAGPATG